MVTVPGIYTNRRTGYLFFDPYNNTSPKDRCLWCSWAYLKNGATLSVATWDLPLVTDAVLVYECDTHEEALDAYFNKLPELHI